MNASLFPEYRPYFSIIIGKVLEKYNGENANQEPAYLHKDMLDEEYSTDLKWGSTTFNNSVVAADVVALGSSLPLKSRPSIENASGTVPKLGVKYKKDEVLLTQIYNLENDPKVSEAQIVAKIFDDIPRVIKGMDIRKEIMFRTALSTGYTATTQENNEGTAVRVSYGYKDENIMTTANNWGTAKATPISDLRKWIDEARDKGDAIEHVWIQREYFNHARTSNEGKELVAFANVAVIVKDATLPTPSREVFKSALEEELGVTLHLITGSFLLEKENGSFEKIQPWAEGAIVGTATTKVGRLVYGTLVEERKPVNGVDYEKAGSHVLVSKYSANEPSYEEFTAGQALCLPVIDGGSMIHVLNAKK